MRLPMSFTLAAMLAALGAHAAEMDGAQAKARMEAAGYQDVGDVHQGNLGDYMARATRDGRPVLIVMHADGSVALRQQVAVPPVVLPADSASPPKP